MPAHVLGHRMQDDIAAVLDGTAKRRRGHGIVDDDRYAVRVGHVGDGFHIGDIAGGIAD